MIAKVNGTALEKILGGDVVGHLRFLARRNGGLPKTFREVVLLGMQTLEAQLDERSARNHPAEPRYSSISR